MKVKNLGDTITEVEYFFKDTSDAVFLLVVDKFSFFNESNVKSVNKKFDEFLDHCGLTEIWYKFKDDLVNPNTYFRRLEPEQHKLCDEVRNALLVASYNRLRRLTRDKVDNGKHHTSTGRS